MPVDPGHLTLLARCGDLPVLVAPGSARSSRHSSFDLLHRTFRGRECRSTPGDIAGARGRRPREDTPRGTRDPRRAAPAAPRGSPRSCSRPDRSRRMGPVNKLLAPKWTACPMLARSGRERRSPRSASRGARGHRIRAGPGREAVLSGLGKCAWFTTPTSSRGSAPRSRRGSPRFPRRSRARSSVSATCRRYRRRSWTASSRPSTRAGADGRSVCRPATASEGIPCCGRGASLPRSGASGATRGPATSSGSTRTWYARCPSTMPPILLDVDSPDALARVARPDRVAGPRRLQARSSVPGPGVFHTGMSLGISTTGRSWRAAAAAVGAGELVISPRPGPHRQSSVRATG